MFQTVDFSKENLQWENARKGSREWLGEKVGVCAIKDDLLANMRPTIGCLQATFHITFTDGNLIWLLTWDEKVILMKKKIPCLAL